MSKHTPGPWAQYSESLTHRIKQALTRSRTLMHEGIASEYLKSLRQIMVIQERALEDGQPVSDLLINRTLVEHHKEMEACR